MKRILCILLIVLAFGPAAKGQTIEADLGDSSFVSLITMGPGEEFYTAWGHSAIRVCDSTIGLDLVYNYGTFDFDTPHFYLKFARGALDYCLSRTTFANTLAQYAWEGRALWEQRLDLSRQERNNLLVLLEENYRPEFRYYKYDFFRDNCATRVSDMLQASLCHRAMFSTQRPAQAPTYRDIVYQESENQLWWRLGVDLLLGLRCDRPMSNLEQQFSPLELKAQMDTNSFTFSTLQWLEEQPREDTFTPHPTMTFWLLFLVVLSLTIIGWAKQRPMLWLDGVLFWLAGMVCLLLSFMWFGTNHYCTKWNINLLWANPLLLYLAIWLRRPNRVVVWVALALQVATLVCCLLLPLNAAVAPIALTLFVRILNKLKTNDLQYETHPYPCDLCRPVAGPQRPGDGPTPIQGLPPADALRLHVRLHGGERAQPC